MMKHQSNFIGGNSLNQFSSSSSNKNQNNQFALKNRTQLMKHTENIIDKQQRPAQRSISILKKSPVKIQSSLLQKRTILNTMNSNLIANQYNSNNLLINSLMKTTINPTNIINNLQEKNNTSSSSSSSTSSTPIATSDSLRVDDKMIKVIKLCVTRLEFSSPLFRRIATKMSFLYFKPNYEQVHSYERFCSTSNKTVLKQVMNKAHTLKYKPARNRSRMLRSNEIG